MMVLLRNEPWNTIFIHFHEDNNKLLEKYLYLIEFRRCIYFSSIYYKKTTFFIMIYWYIDTLNLDILCFRIHFMKNFWKGNINFCSRLFLPNLSYYLYAPYIILNRISRKTQETEYVYSFKTKFSCRSYFTFSSNVINILEI